MLMRAARGRETPEDEVAGRHAAMSATNAPHAQPWRRMANSTTPSTKEANPFPGSGSPNAVPC